MNSRTIGGAWAITGISLLLGVAIFRLTPHSITVLQHSLTPVQGIVLFVWCVFMLLSEGYGGFQKRFSPRFAARTRYLMRQGKAIDIVLAPFFSMGYYRATRKRLITSWSLTAGIIFLIIIVRSLPTPWRGLVDAGVVLGLIYGLICTYICTYTALTASVYDVDPEIGQRTEH